MKKKELWLQNNGTSDINLSDLGVKVPAGTTINVFAYNPYLSEEQVKKSMEEGSTGARLKAGLIRQVAGKPQDKEVKQIQVSKEPVKIVKERSSIFVETKSDEILEADDLTGIADYGLDGVDAVKVKVENGATVVEQKDDNPTFADPSNAEAKMEIVAGKNISDQSVMVMAKQLESQSNPVGKIVPSASEGENFYIEGSGAPKVQAKKEMVVVAQEKDDADEPAESEKPEAVKEGDTVVLTPKKDRIEDKKSDGMRVATKNKDGTVVMTLKEE